MIGMGKYPLDHEAKLKVGHYTNLPSRLNSTSRIEQQEKPAEHSRIQNTEGIGRNKDVRDCTKERRACRVERKLVKSRNKGKLVPRQD